MQKRKTENPESADTSFWAGSNGEQKSVESRSKKREGEEEMSTKKIRKRRLWRKHGDEGVEAGCCCCCCDKS